MSVIWSERLTELENYITIHPGVVIEETNITIPPDKRTEFYRLFNQVRTAFISEIFPDLFNTTSPLSRAYPEVQQDVKQLLALDNIVLPEAVERFIRDPLDGLARVLWSHLFKLLKGKINPTTFKAEGARVTKEAYDFCYYKSYESWLELSLLKLFESRKLQRVPVPAASASFDHAQSEAIHLKLSNVYAPIESRELSFTRSQPHTSFTVPDFIIYSEKLGKYVSARAEPHEARWIATDASENRDWLPILNEHTKAIFAPGYILLFTANVAEDIALVNDVNKICRPDLIIEFRARKSLYEEEELRDIKLRHDYLKPVRGTCILTGELVPPLAPGGQTDIHILEVGFNQSKLKSIVDILISSNDNDH
jgi:hypothetical protein